MPRKVSHKNRIKVIRNINPGNISAGEVIQFRYSKQDINDLKPLVFVFEKTRDYIKGINLNYLTEYRVQQLLQETNLRKMRWYELYDEAIRTYKKNGIKSAEVIEYTKDKDAS